MMNVLVIQPVITVLVVYVFSQLSAAIVSTAEPFRTARMEQTLTGPHETNLEGLPNLGLEASKPDIGTTDGFVEELERIAQVLTDLLGSPALTDSFPEGVQQNCGYSGIQAQQCQDMGCAWLKFHNYQHQCFLPGTESPEYIVTAVWDTPTGLKASLNTNSSSGRYGTPITPVMLQIDFDTDQRLHVKFTDDTSQRWEIPSKFSPVPDAPTKQASNPMYTVIIAEPGEVFFIKIGRRSDGEIIFDSTATTSSDGFAFFDQYLSIATRLPSSPNIYGLGERVHSLKLSPGTYTMWNFDTPTPPNVNLYGSHPFYMDLRRSGAAHGVFLRNSNGMDVTLHQSKLRQSTLTYKVIGGVLDFYFFLGPTPEEVVVQYQQVIGRPHMPPYWALGFHQCRYGYENVQALETAVSRYATHQIPLDTMWSDIDYMDANKDFTLSPTNYPRKEMISFVSKLHGHGQRYVIIIDPGIHNQDGYAAYEDGKEQDIFIKDRHGKIFIGRVWPGTTAFPDFFNPKAVSYWKNEISKFLDVLPVDGLWIDMNEISSLCNGSCADDLGSSVAKAAIAAPQERSGFDAVNPPYAIHNHGGDSPLNVKTLDMDCVHDGGILEYNAHNLYGVTEAIATNNALQTLQGKRSLIISRSTFPGSGSHTGHWTGDNHASWDDLYNSIPGMLNFQLFGIPLVGSDICGFIGNTTEELCGRWMQLGAFYPFSRNHNMKGAASQEPYIWESVASISRKVLGVRYSILPYYYTLFHLANKDIVDGDPVATGTVTRPLFFEFPTDPNTFALDKQFLVGPGLLVSPVLTQGTTSVDAYFPAERWFDYYDGAEQSSTGAYVSLSAPMDHINLHIRGGVTIPRQTPALTTKATRTNPFNLLVALDEDQSSLGYLFLDDGDSLGDSSHMFITYTTTCESSGCILQAKVTTKGSLETNTPKLDAVTVYGVSESPLRVFLNKKAFTNFAYDASNKVVIFSSMSQRMEESFVLFWL
ncbi:uncharacterized protein LOC135820114 [Sycon ciliatum]|uniref:uncharacterized protein LOC135820114 n=1 Tax=Sycon ciliatum TaxID=27933 RepID=UPI0031F615DE